LLVLQGDNDPRVPKEGAQQVVDILKKEVSKCFDQSNLPLDTL